MSKRSIIFGILSIAVMIAIFMFSAKDGNESTDQSLKVGMTIGRITVKNFEELPKEKQISFAKKINYAVRKSAHFTEYMILGFMFAGFFTGIKKLKRRMQLPSAWITGTLYAFTDELHQMFVPGRACRLFDVMIDSSGVLTGVLVMTVILFIVGLRRKKERKIVKNNNIEKQ